jgi:LysM repeat protein
MTPPPATAISRHTAHALRVFLVVVSVLALVGCSGGTKKHAASVASTTTSATTAAPTTTTIPARIYTVKSGDTLSAIANRFHATVSAIMARNHLKNADKLALGQRLSLPPPLPLALVVSPARGAQGDAFHFTLTGAAPGETITFKIQSPKSTYSGAPHTAAIDGSVNATYQTAFTDPTGKYNVTASGNKGTTLSASFVVTKNALAP